MRAVFQDRYGSPDKVLGIRDLPKPVPGPGEVLVKVRAASLHPDVWHVVTGRPWVLRLMGSGLGRPKQAVPGTDLAGTVEALGPGAARFSVGDEVFGESHGGFQWLNGGAFAEYAAVPESALVRKPAGVSFEAAACVPTAGIIALMNLGFAPALGPGRQVLINGAGGGVGSVALQAAKAAGAAVTAVERPGRLDLVRSLGADHVLEAGSPDLLGGGARFDLVFDVASNLSLADSRRILKPEGRYIMIGHDHFGRSAGRVLGSLPRAIGHMFLSLVSRMVPKPEFKTPPKITFLEPLRALLEKGALTPVVGRAYGLEEVGQAMRDLQQGQVPGRLVLKP